MPDDTDDPFSLERRKKITEDALREAGLTADSASSALAEARSAFKAIEEQRSALKQFLPDTTITDGILRSIAPETLGVPPLTVDIDVENFARSLAETKRAEQEALAGLIAGPITEVLARHLDVLTAQQEAQDKSNAVLEQQTEIIREQGQLLEQERSKRAEAEEAEATARARDRLRTTLIVAFAFATTVLTAVLVYIAVTS